MCGRFTNRLTWSEIVALYRLSDPPAAGAPNLRPRYNIAPSQKAPVVRVGDRGGRELAMLRWGLIPFWAKDEKIGYRTINARAETVAEKPAFRAAFRRRRCLVPASGFYEWTKGAAGKQPWHFTLEDGAPMSFAGLWERWEPDDGADLETFTIIVTEANDSVRPYHHRMPVILAPASWDPWLDHEAPVDDVRPFLRPYDGKLYGQRVSRDVNNVANDGPDLLAL